MSDELIELKRIGENLQDGVLRRCGHCGETYESRHPGNCPTCGCDNRVGNERFPHFQEAERLRAENQRLRRALRECVECLDVDNLTQQSRYREWKKMARGGE